MSLFFDTAKEAADLILEYSEPYKYESIQRRMREEAKKGWDTGVFLTKIEDYIAGRRNVPPKKKVNYYN